MCYKIKIAFALSLAAILFLSEARGQVRNLTAIVPDTPRTTGPVRIRPPRKPQAKATQSKAKIVIKTQPVMISSLSVNSEAGAVVNLESVALDDRRAKVYKKMATAAKDGSVIFADLPPGQYKLTAAKEGFVAKEDSDLRIVAKRAQVAVLELDPLVYKLRIQTNLKGGSIQFAPANFKGKSADGRLQLEPKGNFCVVQIDSKGVAEVAQLREDYYTIDIRPDGLEYETAGRAIKIPDDLETDDIEATTALKTFPVTLEKNISTENFSAAWVQDNWQLPKAWRLDRDKGLKVNSEGMALPKNDRFRHYVDFEMIADVKLKDQGMMGFVLRAEDPNNYYLLQVSGAKGESPDAVSLFTVKNGARQLVDSVRLSSFAKMVNGNVFRIYVEGEKEYISILMDDASGRKHGLGRFPDQYKTYPKGAVGIVGFPKSDFEVAFFRVCPKPCRD